MTTRPGSRDSGESEIGCVVFYLRPHVIPAERLNPNPNSKTLKIQSVDELLKQVDDADPKLEYQFGDERGFATTTPKKCIIDMRAALAKVILIP